MREREREGKRPPFFYHAAVAVVVCMGCIRMARVSSVIHKRLVFVYVSMIYARPHLSKKKCPAASLFMFGMN
jgi:hypothetical protein